MGAQLATIVEVMNDLFRDEYERKLVALMPSGGKTISNKALRAALSKAFPLEQFTLDDYWSLLRSLILAGKIKRTRSETLRSAGIRSTDRI